MRFRHLSSLDLSNNRIGDELVAELANLDEISFLNLAQTEISKASLNALKWLKALKVLHLFDAGADDDWIENIVQLNQISELDISGNDFTEVGIMGLAKMRNLRSLTVGELNISEDGLNRLQDAMPNCAFYE